MTDREFLLNLKSMIDAQLGIAPGATPSTPPAGSPLANSMATESMGGTILAGYAGSNPGPATQPLVPADPVPVAPNPEWYKGTWLEDYYIPAQDDGVPLGFTGAKWGKNYINGHAFKPEYLSQDPGVSGDNLSFAFRRALVLLRDTMAVHQDHFTDLPLSVQ